MTSAGTYFAVVGLGVLSQGPEPQLWELAVNFDRVLATAPSTEPTGVHDDLVRQDGDLMTPKSRMGMNGSQKQMVDEATKLTPVIKPVPKEAFPQEQL